MPSNLEDLLEQKMREAGIPEPEKQLRFARPRLYKADFAWPCGLIVECDGTGGQGPGGTGGHQTRTGIQQDHLRDALAQSSVGGQWGVVRVDRKMVESGVAVMVIEDRLAQRGAMPMRPENQTKLREVFGLDGKPAKTPKPKPEKKADPAKEAAERVMAKHPELGLTIAPPLPWHGADLSMFSPAAAERANAWANEVKAELLLQPPATVRRVVLDEAKSAERKLSA